ncbi:MAG: hypothetical protein K6F71_00095 [Ruminococcus sp.]|uniref:hypothetical protein n=1 Tax=Ruminococcus sp. TaxID=41978 RepID=UPI0025E0FFA6|nr:hypothetical protein [Ruminococcus sp.]MCR5539223.1 hypothetical protein [Ruminococcus sp.]
MYETELKELVAKNINKIEADLIFLEKDHTIILKEKENERECVKFDILALDKNKTPVIIEAKSIKDGSLTYVLEQVGEYLYLLRTKDTQSMSALCKERGIPIDDENKLQENRKKSRIIILVEKREDESLSRLKNAIEVFAESVDIRLYTYHLSDDKKTLVDVNRESPKNIISFDRRIIHKSDEEEKLYEELSGLFAKMKQMKTLAPGRGKLGLEIGDKLIGYMDITHKNGDQVAADFGLSFQSISFYRRTKLLIPEIQEEIRKDEIAVSLASGILSGLDEQQQKDVYGYIATFLRLNADQKINRKKLIVMKKAALKGEKYDDIKFDLLAK